MATLASWHQRNWRRKATRPGLQQWAGTGESRSHGIPVSKLPAPIEMTIAFFALTCPLRPPPLEHW